ncbi:MAG: hypothetical protein V1689_08935 [Pseudomonadota bacterium]
MGEVKNQDLPPCMIYIDKEGHWYHKGLEMIRRDFVQLFYRNMELDSKGRYVIDWNGNRCYVDVEDTAYVVRGVVYEEAKGDQTGRFILYLSDYTYEELIPDTLVVGKENVLYCRVKGGAFPARFNRAAYYQLAEHVEERDNAYYLPLGGERYRILTTHQRSPREEGP